MSGYHLHKRLLRVLVRNGKESKKRGRKTEREREREEGFEDVTLFEGFIPGEI